MVPAGFDDLVLLDHEIAGSVFGGETDHQRVWKRPRLAVEVFDVCDFDPNLLFDLSVHRLFQRFTGFDESCKG